MNGTMLSVAILSTFAKSNLAMLYKNQFDSNRTFFWIMLNRETLSVGEISQSCYQKPLTL